MLKIKTNVLQDVVSKAIKGAGCNKLVPITELMCLKVEGDRFICVTTDGANYLYVKAKEANDVTATCEDFYIVVAAEQFGKLVSKLTDEYTTLNITNNGLEVITDAAKFVINIPLDEDGRRITYPNPYNGVVVENEVKVSKTMFDMIRTVCKPSLADTLDVPVYCNYYFGECVLATDTYTIACVDANVFGENARLIRPTTLDLIGLMTDSMITCYIGRISLTFVSDEIIICTSSYIESDGDTFAVEDIKNCVNVSSENDVVVDKKALISALDRVSLFVGPYDNRAVKLDFLIEGISVSSKKSNGKEIVPYATEFTGSVFSCYIDVDMLMTQVKANITDKITINYGNNSSLKLVDGNISQVIAFIEE